MGQPLAAFTVKQLQLHAECSLVMEVNVCVITVPLKSGLNQDIDIFQCFLSWHQIFSESNTEEEAAIAS